MNRTMRSRRWPAWMAALALLLQGAMPAIAAAASRWQDRPLVEVCTRYGVVWVAPDDEGAATVSVGHGDRCALASIGAALPPAPTLLGSQPAVPCAHGRLRLPPAKTHDAAAAWQSRLAHAPPSRD